MHQIKIEDVVKKTREITIADGIQMIDNDGIGLEKQSIETVEVDAVDGNGDPVLDELGNQMTQLKEQPAVDVNGEPVMEPLLNDSGDDNIITVNKTALEISDEQQVLIDAEEASIQAKMDAYQAAQANQLANGGPGPVGDVEVMQICNEHDCQFEVIFK